MKKTLYVLVSLSALSWASPELLESAQPILQKEDVKEIDVIIEIKKLFQNGKKPEKPFFEWCDWCLPSLTGSSKKPIQELGKLLTLIRQKKTDDIQVTSVLPTFEEAVKEYYPDFSISILKSITIIPTGICWYNS